MCPCILIVRGCNSGVSDEADVSCHVFRYQVTGFISDVKADDEAASSGKAPRGRIWAEDTWLDQILSALPWMLKKQTSVSRVSSEAEA